jgi:two-component system cell cycle response regulator
VTARILVVDDLEPNVRLLRAKLEAEYFEVLTATSGFEAIEIARAEQPDLILLDVMMPGMDGYETCGRLKGDHKTRHIPVIMVTALDQQEDRVNGLRAGADDFLTKPIDDLALLARTRSLLRLKTVMDELRTREAQGRKAGAISEEDDAENPEGGRLLVIDDNAYQSERIHARLCDEYRVSVAADPKEGADAAKTNPDVVIVNVASRGFDGMRLCARIRSDEATRQTPILAIVDPDDKDRIVKALELGVNDVIPRPIEAQELRARVRTQMRHKRYADVLRGRFRFWPVAVKRLCGRRPA